MGSIAAFAQSYGMAGCGLGSVVFGDQKGFIQIAAATTNGTFGTQTFGITSGTSNCVEGEGDVSYFIETNRPALKNDIAKGHGETLTSLAQLYKCGSTESFYSALKTNYSSIFSTNNSAEIQSKIEVLRSSCGA